MPIAHRFLLTFLLVFMLGGCTTQGHSPAVPVPGQWANNTWSSTPTVANPQPWQHFRFPGKQSSQYSLVQEDDRSAVLAVAQSSASVWRQKIHKEPGTLGKLKFSWKVPGLIADADMAVREKDDSPVRVILAFDGDRSSFSPKNAMMSELAKLLTGEELPYATLMYVWCNACPLDSVIVNPRTDRIRKLVLESGPGKLNRWVDYERVIRDDFEKVFGEAPGALLSVGLMTDTDNTQSSIKAWYGPLTLSPVPP